MSLVNNSTKWILFLSSSGDAEYRHIMDLAFGVYCLESKGIKKDDIHLYIDGKNRDFISQVISSGTKNHYNILTSKDFFEDKNVNGYENIVMFVTGHGSINGIDATPTITPYMLLQCIKNTPQIKQAIVYLGQCHAGTFNYIGAGRKKDDDSQVVFIGATNLHASLSSPTQEDLITGPVSWVANLFLLHVFKWISTPIDIDGDGKTTIIDSYKYAGTMSNDANKNIKVTSFVRSLDLHEKWISANKAHDANPTMTTQLELEAATIQYETELNIRYTHQECWILNAIPAQNIEI